MLRWIFTKALQVGRRCHFQLYRFLADLPDPFTTSVPGFAKVQSLCQCRAIAYSAVLVGIVGLGCSRSRPYIGISKAHGPFDGLHIHFLDPGIVPILFLMAQR